MTRISVLTVVKNSMPSIKVSLASLENQTLRNRQHVVIDACSSDGTTAVVKDFKPDVHVIESDEGLYDALNKGIAHADGDVVGVLHGDDEYADRNVLAKVSDEFASNPALDILLTDVVFVDTSAKVIRRYRSDRFSPERLRWGWMPAHTGMYVRRQLYADVGPYRTDYSIAADFEWIARAFTSHDVSYRHLNEITMRMQVGGLSTRSTSARLTLNREVVRACRELGINSGYLRVLSKYPLKVIDKYLRS